MTGVGRAALALLVVAHAAHADNGLTLLLAPDPSTSSVAVHVRYRVDDPRARIVERLMVHVADFEARIDAAGGWTTGTTAADHVGLVEQVPAGALALALWLEAERMANLAASVDDARLARVLTELADEDRAAYVDHPYALVARAVQQALWPEPPSPPATRAAIAALIRDRFGPSNATLVIAGRFDPDDAHALVHRYFGSIPASTRAPDAPRVVPLRRDVDAVAADAVPKAVVAFRTDGSRDVEVAARIVVARARRRLGDGKLASEVHADLAAHELRISATAADGVDPARLADALHAELAGLDDVSADEVRRAATAIEAELAFALESLAFRAEWLAAGNELAAARAALHAVTPATLHHAARTWLAAGVTVLGR